MRAIAGNRCDRIPVVLFCPSVFHIGGIGGGSDGSAGFLHQGNIPVNESTEDAAKENKNELKTIIPI